MKSAFATRRLGVAHGLLLGRAQLSPLGTFHCGFRILTHLRDLGLVPLHEFGLVLQEFAGSLVISFPHRLLLFFRRGFLGGLGALFGGGALGGLALLRFA